MRQLAAVFCAVFAVWQAPVQAQVFPPGNFGIDGFPMVCGQYPTVLTTQIPDVGMFNGQAIILNPVAMGNLPTPLKLYIYAHECAHGVGFTVEAEADCWAIRTGRDQGWFAPQAFNLLMMYFANNPGSFRHPPGPARVQNMMDCYQS